MSFFTNTGASSTGDAAKQPGPSFDAPNTGGSIFGGGVSSTTGTGSLFGNPQPVGGNIFGGGNAAPSAPASGSTGSGVFGNSQNNTNSGSTSAFGTTGNIFGISNNSASTPAAGGNIFGTQNTSTPLPAGGSFGAGAGGSGGGSNNIFGASNNASSSNTTSNPSTNAGSSIFGSGSAFSKPADGGAKPTPTTSIFGQSSTPSTTSAATTTGGNGLFVLPAKPAATTTTPAPTTTAGGGGFFNPSNDSKQPATTSTTPGSTATVNGLFNLNAKPATSPAPAAGTSSTSSTTGGSTLFSGGGIFGQKTATTPAGGYSTATAKEGEKKDGTAPTPFNLFGGAKSIEKKDDNSSKDGEKKDTTAATSSTGASSTPAAIAVQPPSMLRGKSIEEIVNKWSADLETNVRDFNKFAAEVAVWDRALIENGNNIAALFSHVVAAERQQNDINESLSHIEQQQKELATTLDSYERISQDILGGQGGSLRTLDTGPADNERDKNYMLATDLHTHLDDLSGSLTQMIESVNALSIASKPADSADDPMSQISTILSSHLESLQWVDNAVREVEGKTNEIEHRIKDSGHSLSGSKSRGFGLNR